MKQRLADIGLWLLLLRWRDIWPIASVLIASVAGLLMALAIMPPPPHDDTDPPGERSGLHLYIDHRTGCHYLGRNATPRLDKDGKHICTG